VQLRSLEVLSWEFLLTQQILQQSFYQEEALSLV
jgi:hypothetical protein